MLSLTEEQKKEIVKARFYGLPPYQIANIMDITTPDVLQVVKENENYTEELEGRNYVDEGN